MPGLKELRANNQTITQGGAGSHAEIPVPQDRGAVLECTFTYSEGVGDTKANRATMEAGLERVTLYVGGQIFSEYEVPNILKLNDFYGYTFKDGVLPIHFSQIFRHELADAEINAFMAPAHSDPRFSVKIADGRTNPRVGNYLLTEGFGERGRQLNAAAPAQVARPIIKHYQNTLQITSAYTNIPFRYRYSPGDVRTRGIHLTGSNITRVVMLVDGQDVIDIEDREFLNHLLENNGFVPQTDTWHLSFEAMGGNSSAAFNPNFGNADNVIDLEIYTSAAGDVDLLSELYQVPKV